MGGGIAACAISLFFAACVNSEYDGRIDTVYSLATPSVSAKAYPGVNIVSWNPVSGVEYYKVYIYEEGVLKGEDTVSEGYRYSHTDLVNGKNYRYCVEAVGRDGLPAREVYVTNSGRGEASARAIVPPADTKSLELPAYEDGYDGTNKKDVSSSDQWIVNSSNMTVTFGGGKIYVTFPMKAYLDYTVTYYEKDFLDVEISASERSLSCYVNNTLGEVSFDATGAGRFQIEVEARSPNSRYATSDAVEYGSLPVDWNGSDVTASYEEGNSSCVYVEFNPASISGENVSSSWYKIFRHEVGKEDYIQLDTTPSESYEYDYYYKKLYVRDYVPDNSCVYEYVIIVTDGFLWSTPKTSDKAIPFFTENDIDIACTYGGENNIVECVVTCKSEAAKNANIYVKYLFKDYSSYPGTQDFEYYGYSLSPEKTTMESNGDKKLSYMILNTEGHLDYKYVFFLITAEKSSFIEYCYIPVIQQEEE